MFRVLVHPQYLGLWNELAGRVGLANAQQFWDHVAMTPGQPPQVGISSVMKGKHAAPKWPGYSETIHYEITGAGRIDYQFNPAATQGDHNGCARASRRPFRLGAANSCAGRAQIILIWAVLGL